MNQPSAAYYEALKATRDLHSTSKKFNGRFLGRYLPDIEKLVAEHECKTLLDYGCGKAIMWQHPLESGGFLADKLGVKPTLYDPGLNRFAAEPQGKFDIVICTQALGSIPVTDLPWAIGRLYGCATKAVFVGERIKPVKKQLHAHMADQMPHEKPHEWWAEQLRAVPIPEGLTVELRSFDSIRSTDRLERLA